MEFAITDDGSYIEAIEGGPGEANCPECGYPVTLRKRRLMNGRGYVYYWRHKSGGNLSCKARSSIITRGKRDSR